MTHDEYRELAMLSIYGEINPDRRIELAEHLASCEECRKELEETTEFHRLLDRRPAEPPEALLQEARAQLRGALSEIHRSPFQKPPGGRVLQRLSPYRWPLASAAALFTGLALGYLLFASGPAASPAPDLLLAAHSSMANIRLLDSDPSDNYLEVSYDLVRPVHVRGDLQDLRVQEALVQALLNSRNPGVRLRAVDAMHGPPARTLDPHVQETLIYVLKNDENDGVRMRALEFLRGTSAGSQFQEALIGVLLKDDNAGMRVAAISALDELRNPGWRPHPDTLSALKNHLQKEENDFVRLRSEAFLQEVQYR